MQYIVLTLPAPHSVPSAHGMCCVLHPGLSGNVHHSLLHTGYKQHTSLNASHTKCLVQYLVITELLKCQGQRKIFSHNFYSCAKIFQNTHVAQNSGWNVCGRVNLQTDDDVQKFNFPTSKQQSALFMSSFMLVESIFVNFYDGCSALCLAYTSNQVLTQSSSISESQLELIHGNSCVI